MNGSGSQWSVFGRGRLNVDCQPVKLTLHNLQSSRSHYCSLSHMWDLESTLSVSFHRKTWARVPYFICQGSSLCCLVGELSQLSALYVLSSLSVLPQAHMVSWMLHFLADTYTWLISQSTEQWLAFILINISAACQTLSASSFSIVMFLLFFFVLCDNNLNMLSVQVLIGQNKHPDVIVLHFRSLYSMAQIINRLTEH